MEINSDAIISMLESEGVDFTSVMPRFLNKKDFYCKMFLMSLNDRTADDLTVAAEERDREQVFTCAHTLKGVMSNLGLHMVYEPASRLTELVRNDNALVTTEVMALVDEINNALNKLRASVRGI